MQHHDPKALHIAKAVQQREQPELVIRLSIAPDIYAEYAGHLGYRARRQPRLTDQPDYLEKTVADARFLI